MPNLWIVLCKCVAVSTCEHFVTSISVASNTLSKCTYIIDDMWHLFMSYYHGQLHCQTCYLLSIHPYCHPSSFLECLLPFHLSYYILKYKTEYKLLSFDILESYLHTTLICLHTTIWFDLFTYYNMIWFVYILQYDLLCKN